MERGKEEVVPLDEKTMEEIGKQILNHSEFKSIELQERIDKANEYIYKLKQNAPDEKALDKILLILQGKDENK